MKRREEASRKSLSRRRFLEGVGRLAAAASVAGPAVPSLADDSFPSGGRGPINCGPPPKAKPTSRGGTYYPALPMPNSSGRRPGRKKTPDPPALIGKMALGPVRWTTQDNKRVQYRDWMSDPADLDTLLSWTARKLQVSYMSVETDFVRFSFDPRELPAILLAGHNKFELPEAVRPKLAQYVVDGGTIIADACCGWADFAESFRREMELVFPERPLRKILPDDPILSSFHKLGKFTYKKADGSTYTDAPCLETIDFGCRGGVIFSPCDLTCGWDGHEHARGIRVEKEQARRVGANLVTYILGNFQLGQFLGSTKVYHEAGKPTRDDFVFAQLIHQGDWDPDPSAVHNLLKHARDNSTLEVKFKREAVRLTDPAAATSPLLYMTGHRGFEWDEDETVRLRRYLEAGGILLADACCGRAAFDAAFRRQIAKVLPKHKLQPVPVDHALFHCHYDINRAAYTPRVAADFGRIDEPRIEGITIDGKLAVIYSKFDLGNGWEKFPHAYAYGFSETSALRIGTNVIVYAVTH